MFVGLKISKELEKPKEENGIEVRNAIDHWKECRSTVHRFTQHRYQVWKDYPLQTSCRPTRTLLAPLCGVHLLSTLFLGMKVPYQKLGVSDKGDVTYPDLDFYIVYAALKVGIYLLGVVKVKGRNY